MMGTILAAAARSRAGPRAARAAPLLQVRLQYRHARGIPHPGRHLRGGRPPAAPAGQAAGGHRAVRAVRCPFILSVWGACVGGACVGAAVSGEGGPLVCASQGAGGCSCSCALLLSIDLCTPQPTHMACAPLQSALVPPATSPRTCPPWPAPCCTRPSAQARRAAAWCPLASCPICEADMPPTHRRLHLSHTTTGEHHAHKHYHALAL